MDFQEDSVLHIGAEAKVWSGTFLGKQAIKKVRTPRSWRHPSLDHRLGTKRMLNEAKLLIRLFNSGLDVPALLDVNLEDGYLIETRLEGEELKTKLAGDYELEIKHNFLKETGKAIRKLHCLAITHGDLSTNNILIHNQKARLIDFGLAEYYVPDNDYNVRVASRYFKAPELLLQHPYYHYSIDIWALGCLFAGIIFMKEPFFAGQDSNE